MTDTKKILIAEDEKPLSHAMELKLTNAGYSVVVASDGQQAKDKLAAEPFNLILLDLVMPVADGFAVLEDMQAKGIKTPVIVMSNLSQAEDKEKAQKLGATDFMIKSDSSLEEIITRVKSALA